MLEVDDHSRDVIARVSGFHDLPPVVRLVYELHQRDAASKLLDFPATNPSWRYWIAVQQPVSDYKHTCNVHRDASPHLTS